MNRTNYFTACVLSAVLSTAFLEACSGEYDRLPDEELTAFIAKQEAHPVDTRILPSLRREQLRRATVISRIIRMFR